MSHNKRLIMLIILCLSVITLADLPYTIVDTGQVRCYNNITEIEYPGAGRVFCGQDAQYSGNQPAYKDNNDGTVTDLNTGLMWTKDPGGKRTYRQVVADASKCKVGGYSDWRLPTIKELYSLILFSGTDPDPMSANSSRQRPFIDTKYFKFQYGKAEDGDRIIDSQYATCTLYGSTTMGGNKTMFGVNFADGRIKGYPIGSTPARREKTYYVMYVRGNTDYGKNDFKDNGDGTVTDNATGLMWMKVDSGKLKAGINKDGKLDWQQALQWAENLEYAGHSDWRLPNAKELHSIVDYTRCPDVTDSAAIDPIFEVTSITNEGGKVDYPYYWTSTTHAKLHEAGAGVYIAFGRALGWMQDRRTSQRQLQDVHGAGAQRSDPKSGDPSQFPYGRGPQGDVVRIYNYVRCLRNNLKSMPSKIRFSPAIGIGPEKGIMRRDPSDIIRVGDLYYVWYTKGRVAHGYDATVWYATSPNGHKWTERGEALARGPKGSWDEQSVFTPNILVAEGKYWLFYTAVPKPFFNRGNKVTKTAIGVAVASSPNGPWQKLKTNPILKPSDDPNEFDSMRVDDACLIVREGRYWLYYKGRQWDNTPGNTKMGVAIADKPDGPYVKHERNPVVPGGHEVLVWPLGTGVMAMINIGLAGIRRTLQYAPDGLAFSKYRDLPTVPNGPGAYRPEAFADSGTGEMIEWGVHIGHKKGFLPFIERFDCRWPRASVGGTALDKRLSPGN